MRLFRLLLITISVWACVPQPDNPPQPTQTSLPSTASEAQDVLSDFFMSFTFKEMQGDTYIFQVEFRNPDGTLFVLGPCCDADETEMPPVSQFECKVTRNYTGKFVVMDLPPYVP